MTLPHVHDTGAECLACDVELVQDDICAGMSPSPRPVHLALERIEAALASQRAELGDMEREVVETTVRWQRSGNGRDETKMMLAVRELLGERARRAGKA